MRVTAKSKSKVPLTKEVETLILQAETPEELVFLANLMTKFSDGGKFGVAFEITPTGPPT